MELIRGLHNICAHHHGCVATIGNFDGVHLGHQAVLTQLAEKAAELKVPTLVMTFEPYPQEYFRPDQAPPRLTRLREKLLALRDYAVDRVLMMRFDAACAAMEAEDFIEQVLVKKLGVRYLVVGDDFRFGKQRRGDLAMLQQAGERFGFQVVGTHTFECEGERVSSTRIRQALKQGQLQTVRQLLGRGYRIAGRVVLGDQRGRLLGYPTANIHLHRRVSPLSGVFAVEMHGLGDTPLPGVANIGVRPTVDGTRCLLEVHLLDFNQEIYRRYVQVEFLSRLRDEQRFESLDALKAQINIDEKMAREFFSRSAGGQQPLAVL